MSIEIDLESLSLDELNSKYELALGELLLPPHKVQELISSQSVKNKIQTIQLQNKTAKSTGVGAIGIKLIQKLRANSSTGII